MIMKQTISYISFIVHENKLFNINDNLLCAISGGQDSILLLLILYHLQVSYKLNLNVTYCNHFWQLKNFFTEFQLFKVAYLINSPIITIIPKSQIHSEELGHIWRQQSFFKIRNYSNCNSILLGHTASDQIETALWHLFRGAGSQGLLSIKSVNTFKQKKFSNPLSSFKNYPKKHRRFKFIQTKITLNYSNTFEKNVLIDSAYKIKFFERDLKNCQKLNVQKYYILKGKGNSRKINIVKRPLLNFYRSSITNLVNKTTIPIIFDSTNTSKQLLRNKIRLIILPLLNYYIQNKCQFNIKNYLALTFNEQNYLSILTQNLINNYLENPLLIKSVLTLPPGVQQGCLKQICQNYTFKQFKIEHIQKIRHYF